MSKRKYERKRLSFQDLATMGIEEEKVKEIVNVEEDRKDNGLSEHHNELDEMGESDLTNLFISKPTMEETHRRRTFLIRNDLLKQLDKTSDKPKNFTKTKFINYILEKGLKELRKKSK